MAIRYGPKYDIPTGYAVGEGLVNLGQLLRQSMNDWQRHQTVDEESSRRDADYLLRLQQFMAGQEDRGLDRDLKQRQITGLEEARAQTAADRKAAAELAGRERKGRRTMWQTLGGPEMGDDAEITPDLITALQKKLESERPKEPKEPPATMPPGHGLRQPDGSYTVPVPVAEKPPAPSAERDYRAMAIEELGDAAPEAAIARRTRELAQRHALERSDAMGAALSRRQEEGDVRRDLLKRAQLADEAESELAQVDTILTRMDKLVPKVATPGLLGRAAGLTTRKLEEYQQTNPDINELASLGEGYISVIAKIVQRQSGILSNQDLSRAEKSVPQVSDNLEVATRKITVLKEILGTARQNLKRLRTGQPATTLDAGTPTPSRTPDFRYNPATGQLEPVR